MISGFAKGFAISGDAKYLQIAKKAVEFIENKLTSNDGHLRLYF